MLSKPFALTRKLIKSSSFWQSSSFVIKELAQSPKLIILAVTCAILAAAFEGFGVGFILTFLQSLTEPNAASVRTGIDWFDLTILGINAPATERIFRISALILCTTWLRSVFFYYGRVYSWIIQTDLLDRLRKKLFEQFQSVNLSYFSQTRSGELIHILSAELEKLQYCFETLSFLVIRGATLVAYVMSMFLISWQLSLLSMILFQLIAFSLSGVIRKLRKASGDVSESGAKFLGIAVELINGIRTINAFATQDFERRRFYAASENVTAKTLKTSILKEQVEPFGEAAATSVLIGMIVVAFVTLIPSGKLQVSALLTFLFVLFRLVPIIRQVNGARAQLSYYEAPLYAVQELLRTDNKPYLENGTRPFQGLQRSIEFIAVDFGYFATQPVLSNIRLTIKQGQMTALVGGSGAGKSTLADLILRFHDVRSGQILIDGVDLRELDVHSLRRRIAIVSQDTFIFNASIRDNIAYGSEGASDHAIQEAAQIANALEFIQELPEGFETQLGDRGVRLSGGQRQRLAIARAVLRNPDILILDEATSALDSVSERLIQGSLEKLAQGRTVIVIAHRLSTIVRAEKVVVLEQGRIVEQGNYQELLDRRGKLWSYHQMQYELGHSA
jgi:ATP-binding cassette, subfamily B, bacterial MsbA